jgi:hypothetical protein
MSRGDEFMKTLGIAFALVAATASAATWPALPTSGFVFGRLATQDDLDKGDGVFRFEVGGKSITKPTRKVQIPQYAYLKEKGGNRRPVVVVQAELLEGDLTLGLRDAEGKEYVAAGEEVELLGVSHP